MPTNVAKTAEQERLWKKAKKQAAAQGRAKDYAYIMGIFKRMTGMSKAHLYLDNLQKAGPYIGPKGGKWADPQHTIPWRERLAHGHMPKVGDKHHLAPKGMHAKTVQITKVEDGQAHVQAGDGHRSMPVESVKHFVNDLNGHVELKGKSGHKHVDKVISGEAKHLGKGDDGIAFKVGDKVVKMSTTVPYEPMNPGHRTPKQAADMLQKQSDAANQMAKDGVPGILTSEMVHHGDKAFQIKDYVTIPEKFTREQLDEAARSVRAAHEKGWTFNDQIQIGLLGDKVVHFDTGKAQKRTSKMSIQNDLDGLKTLYRNNGFTYVNPDTKHYDAWSARMPLSPKEIAGLDEKQKKRFATDLAKEARLAWADAKNDGNDEAHGHIMWEYEDALDLMGLEPKGFLKLRLQKSLIKTAVTGMSKARLYLDNLQKAGPYIGPRGGKWADPQHTIPWHEGVASEKIEDDAHNIVRKEVVAAAHRAASAGADPKSMRYMNAGAEGILFRDKSGRVFKVGRARRGLENEAAAAKILGEHKLGPRVHSYSKKYDVIVRDHAEGRPGGWSQGRALQETHKKITRLLADNDFTRPEFKEDSFIIGEDGSHKMVDVGFVHPMGKRLADKLRGMDISPDSPDQFRIQLRINNAFKDGALTYEEARGMMSKLGDDQRKHGLEILDSNHQQKTVDKSLTLSKSSNPPLVLAKAAHHKYLRRIPTGKPRPKYRYIYSVNSKHHAKDLHLGEKIRVSHGDKAGHYEIKERLKDGRVRAVHDETGDERIFHREALRDLFHSEHAEEIQQKHEDLKDFHRRAKKHGSKKQKQRAADELKRFREIHRLSDDEKADKLPTSVKGLWGVYKDILDTAGIKDHDSAVQDKAYYDARVEASKPKRLRSAPKPTGEKVKHRRATSAVRQLPAMKWGGLDSFNEGLDRKKKLTSVFHGFEDAVRRNNIKTWRDLEPVLDMLREVPGFSRVGLPDDVLERHVIEDRQKKDRTDLRAEDVGQEVPDSYDPEDDDGDTSFDFGANVDDDDGDTSFDFGANVEPKKKAADPDDDGDTSFDFGANVEPKKKAAPKEETKKSLATLLPDRHEDYGPAHTVPVSMLDTLQTRSGMSPGRVERVREARKAGKRLDPIEVDVYPSGVLSIGDGNHRLKDARDAKLATTEVKFRKLGSANLWRQWDAARKRGLVPPMPLTESESKKYNDTIYKMMLESQGGTMRKAEQPLKDPKGGLTEAGRRHFERKEGGDLKPGVKGAADTPEKMRRKGSFLRRHYAGPAKPLVDDNGKPTRHALQASAWGEPVPKTQAAVRRLAAKGKALLERYESAKKSQMNKALTAPHPVHTGQAVPAWTRVPGAASMLRQARERNPDERYVLSMIGRMPKEPSPEPSMRPVYNGHDVVRDMGLTPGDESQMATDIDRMINASPTEVALRKAMAGWHVDYAHVDRALKSELAKRTLALYRSKRANVGDYVTKSMDPHQPIEKAFGGRQSKRSKLKRPMRPGEVPADNEDDEIEDETR